jgi:sterol desaturase/sphingolipid hydroxylase (fatty acid hydroxylase superfamily)
LGFATHLRFHWMETIAYRTVEYIPLAMIGFGIQEFFLVHIIALAIGHFNHSNIYVPLGPLKYVFNNPQFHKWHHVKDLPERREYGINFAPSLSLWDYLFGTAEEPYEGRDIEIGYPNDEEMPKSFWGQIAFPFTKRSQEHSDPE